MRVLRPQRRALEARAGQTLRVTAEFVRKGARTAGRHTYSTVLVRDVREVPSGVLLADHLWFTCGNTWAKAALVPGDLVTFKARPIEYRTGYWGSNAVRRRYDVPRVDFRLTPPKDLDVLTPANAHGGEARHESAGTGRYQSKQRLRRPLPRVPVSCLSRGRPGRPASPGTASVAKPPFKVSRTADACDF